MTTLNLLAIPEQSVMFWLKQPSGCFASILSGQHLGMAGSVLLLPPARAVRSVHFPCKFCDKTKGSRLVQVEFALAHVYTSCIWSLQSHMVIQNTDAAAM